MTSIENVYARALQPYARPFRPDALLEEAEEATGKSDWGGLRLAEERFRKRLEQLCEALESQAQLTAVGRTRAHARLHIALCSRLRVIDYCKSHDVDRPIRAPLIGTGFPRAGTSFLHELLAQDPHNLAPTSAQAMIPVPPPTDPHIDAQRSAFVDRAMDLLGFYSAEADAIHPSGPDQPDECTLVQEAALAPIFGTFFNVPAFADAARSQTRDMFDWEVTVLQVLQANRPDGRWVLKTPEHMMNWSTLIETFPDARIFMNHRDPVKVVASICSLQRLFLEMNGNITVPTHSMGKRLCQGLAHMMSSVLQWREQHPEKKVVDVHYKRLVADPILEAERIYHEFGMELSAIAKQRMAAFLQRNRHGRGAKTHHYALEDFGVTTAMVDDVFELYMEKLGIDREH